MRTVLLPLGLLLSLGILSFGCSRQGNGAAGNGAATGAPELKTFKSSAPHDLPEALEAVYQTDLTPQDEEVLERAGKRIETLWNESQKRPLPAKSERVSAEFERGYVEWITKLYVEEFKKHGNHDSRFNDEATALVKECLTPPFHGPEAQARLERGKKMFAAGYHDPMLRYLCASTIEIETPEQAYEVIDLLWPALESWDKFDYPPEIRYKIPLFYAEAESKTGHEPFWPDGPLLQAIADSAQALARPMSDYERRFFLTRIEQDLKRFLGQHKDRFYARLAATADADPWFLQILLGREHIQRAWGARGGGYAGSVTKAGWEGFERHLTKARALLLAAWEKRPDCPEAAAQLIPLTMGLDGLVGENTRFWFDQAVEAEFDHRQAYESLRWSLRPRWGGSTQAIYAFGRECLDTGRYETHVPWQYHFALVDVADDVQERAAVYSAPGVYELYVEMLDRYREEAKEDESRRQLDSWHACMACLANRPEDAQRLFDQLGEDVVVQSFADFNVTLAEMKLRLKGQRSSELMSRTFNPGVTRLAFSGDGRRLMALGPGTGATLWEAGITCRELPAPKASPGSMAIRDADLSTDGRSIIMITLDSQHQPSPGKLELWTSAETEPLDVQEQILTSVRFSPDDRLIAVGTRAGSVLFFDAKSRARLDRHAIATGQGIIPSLEFSPDGRRLATTGENNTVKVFDLAFGKQGELQSVRDSQTLGPFDSLSWSVDFSPDGKRLLVGRSETELWQLEPQQKLRTVTGSVVAFSPDGETFATGGGELTTSIHVWKTETGEVVHKLAAGHVCPVYTIAFSPSGKRIVSGSRSFELRMLGKVRCWDASTGDPAPDFSDEK